MSLSPSEIINKMIGSDKMSQWLGIKVISYEKGAVIISMLVKEEMVNGFNVAHGGITYSLADSALAFSANSHGIHSMSIETSISHQKMVKVGDILIAQSKELSLSKKIGVYEVSITNQNKVLVAHFKGTVYRSGKEWE